MSYWNILTVALVHRCLLLSLQTVHSGLLWSRDSCSLHPGAEQPPVEGEDSQLHQKGGLSSLLNFKNLFFFPFVKNRTESWLKVQEPCCRIKICKKVCICVLFTENGSDMKRVTEYSVVASRAVGYNYIYCEIRKMIIFHIMHHCLFVVSHTHEYNEYSYYFANFWVVLCVLSHSTDIGRSKKGNTNTESECDTEQVNS